MDDLDAKAPSEGSGAPGLRRSARVAAGRVSNSGMPPPGALPGRRGPGDTTNNKRDCGQNSTDDVDANGLSAPASKRPARGAAGRVPNLGTPSLGALPGRPGRAPGGVAVPMSAGDCYNMNHRKRGKAVIFNNKTFDRSTGMGERTGTDVDARKMDTILSEMGFDTKVIDDRSARDMELTLLQFAQENHEDADCFVCVVLSHGEEGAVYGTDGPLKIEKLVGPFKGHECTSLAGKPKIFFIQACRGDKLDGGVDVTDAKADAMETDVDIRKIPSEADFLMAYSVVPGYFAWRNSSRGSWFVQALTEVLRENWKRMDLMSMMTRVNRKVAYDFESNASKEFMSRKKQIPCITTMLTRDVYFTPRQ